MDASGSCSPARRAAARSQPNGRAPAAATRFDAPDGVPNLRLPVGRARPRRCAGSTSSAPFPGYPPRESLQSAPRARRAQRLRPTARSRDSRRCAHRRRRLRHRSDVLCTSRAPTAWSSAPICTRASLALGAAAARAIRSRARAVRRDRSPPARPPDAAPSTSSTRRASCTTPATRARRSANWSSWHVPAASSCSVSTTRSRAFPRGCDARSRACPAIVSCPSIRCLRDRAHDPERREAWLRDQYQHPEEHRHTIAEVQRWFAENGVEYLRTYPSAVFDDEPEDLFTRAADNWGLESWLAQLALDAHARARGRTVLHDRAEGGLTSRSIRTSPSRFARSRPMVAIGQSPPAAPVFDRAVERLERAVDDDLVPAFCMTNFT